MFKNILDHDEAEMQIYHLGNLVENIFQQKHKVFLVRESSVQEDGGSNPDILTNYIDKILKRWENTGSQMGHRNKQI